MRVTRGSLKCIRRASKVVWWPGMARDIRDWVRRCVECREFHRKPREPLISTPLPERPWWRLGADICEREGRKYLVVVDYFSRYITVHELPQGQQAEVVVDRLESLFCLLGVPHSIVSDNGPPFGSEEFRKFCERLDIVHVTSSPRYPQSNGEAERAVQTVKGLMSKNVNLRMALCAYRDSPLANGYSPAELLFGRSLNSMGIAGESCVDVNRLRSFEKGAREKRAAWYDRRYRTREAETVPLGENVLVHGAGTSGKAVVVATRGRELALEGESGRVLRRNRLLVRPDGSSSVESTGVHERGEEESGVLAPNVRESVGTSGVLAPSVRERSESGSVRAAVDQGRRTSVQRPEGGGLTPPVTGECVRAAGVLAPAGVTGGDRVVAPTVSCERGAYVMRSGRSSRAPSRLNL